MSKKLKPVARVALVLFLLVISSQVAMAVESAIISGPGHYELTSEPSYPLRIPFKMHRGKPVFDARLNGHPARLMIDNGVLWDEVWLFGTPLVEKLRLTPQETYTIGGSGQGEATEAFSADELTMEIGDIVFHEQPVLVSPESAGFARVFPGTDGQLSKTLFGHFIVEFDFVGNQVLLHDPERYLPGDKAIVLPMRLTGSGVYEVPFSLVMHDGQALEGWVDIDFGGIYALKLALNGSHPITVPAGAIPTRSFGAQGQGKEYESKISSMTLGPFTFEQPKVYFGDEKTSRIHPGNLGVIGLPLFRKFDTVFDYYNGRLILTPNRNFDGVVRPQTGLTAD